MLCNNCNRLHSTYHITTVLSADDSQPEGGGSQEGDTLRVEQHYCAACAVLKNLVGADELNALREGYNDFLERERESVSTMTTGAMLQFAFNAGWRARSETGV